MTMTSLDAPTAGWYPDPLDETAWRWWDGAAWTSELSGPEPVVVVAPEPAPAPIVLAPEPEPAPIYLTAVEVAAVEAAMSPEEPAPPVVQEPVVQASVTPATPRALTVVPDIAPVRRAQDWGWPVAPSGSGGSVATPYAAERTATDANTAWIWILAFSFYIVGFVTGLVQGITYSAGLPVEIVAPLSLVVGIIPAWIIADRDRAALKRKGLPAPAVLWMLLLPPLGYFLVRRSLLRGVGARSRGPYIAFWIVFVTNVVQVVLGIIVAFVMMGAAGIPVLGV